MKRFAGLLIVFLCLPAARADSLWERRDPRFANLFEDNRPRRVGDILTIVVRENTDIEQKDEREQKKKTKMEGNFSFAGSMEGNTTSKKAAASLDTAGGTNKELDARSEYTSDRRFIDRMSVVVIAVLPNGNLVVEGHRKRVVGGEMRTLMMRGIVWPAHIGPANTIQSQYIANFQVFYIGKGTETRTLHHGWFGKGFHKVWPF